MIEKTGMTIDAAGVAAIVAGAAIASGASAGQLFTKLGICSRYELKATLAQLGPPA